MRGPDLAAVDLTYTQVKPPCTEEKIIAWYREISPHIKRGNLDQLLTRHGIDRNMWAAVSTLGRRLISGDTVAREVVAAAYPAHTARYLYDRYRRELAARSAPPALPAPPRRRLPCADWLSRIEQCADSFNALAEALREGGVLEHPSLPDGGVSEIRQAVASASRAATRLAKTL